MCPKTGCELGPWVRHDVGTSWLETDPFTSSLLVRILVTRAAVCAYYHHQWLEWGVGARVLSPISIYF